MSDMLTSGGPEDCAGSHEGPCHGPVEPHQSLSGASWAWRCALHQADYLERQQRRRENAMWRGLYNA